MASQHNHVSDSLDCGTVSVQVVIEMQQESHQDEDQVLRANLIEFAAMLFRRMNEKYGGATTLNELVMLNYGFLCNSRGEAICVTKASHDLGMSKSTVSRIITGMRAKGFVTESAHPTDGRRRVFTLADAYLHRGDDDIQNFLDWCARPENKLA